MARRRRSIILLLATLWISPAWADGAGRMTVARQNYAYSPRTDSVTLELTTVYSGPDAEGFRDLYRRLGPDGYSRVKLDYYRTMYSAVAEAAPVTVKDDGDTVETHERYTVSLAAPDDDTLKHHFPIYPDLLRGFFSALPPTIQQPYALDGTLDRRDIVTVTAPTLGTYTLRDGAVSGSYFDFTRKASARPGHVEMDYRLRFHADSVALADYEQYRSDIERMDHNIYAWIDLDRDFYHRHSQDIPTMIRAAAVAGVVALAGGILWFVRRRQAPS
jgi:hypothetical protein